MWDFFVSVEKYFAKHILYVNIWEIDCISLKCHGIYRKYGAVIQTMHVLNVHDTLPVNISWTVI